MPCQCRKSTMTYTHLSREERHQIYALRRQGISLAVIAAELKRNAGTKGCAPAKAHERARSRQSARRNARQFDEQQWAQVHSYLGLKLSPEQVSGRLKVEGTMSISYECIYLHIYADKRAGGLLARDLRCQKARRKRYGSGQERRGTLKDRVSTELRPAIVDERSRIGDWEGDTVVGKGHQGVLLTLVEHVFSGFLDAEDTAKAITADGWLATGDLGWLDAQGRLNLSGRFKDLIIRSGHNIDPKVIEDALGAHPAVQLCAAVGAPDAYAGELPVAFALLVPGAEVTEAELLAFTAARVDEAPALPKSVTVIAAMPMTNVGKIYKPELRMLAAQQVASALVNNVCDELAVETMHRPTVEVVDVNNGQALRVRVDADALGAAAAPLKQQLSQALGRLPIKAAVTSGATADIPASQPPA